MRSPCRKGPLVGRDKTGVFVSTAKDLESAGAVCQISGSHPLIGTQTVGVCHLLAQSLPYIRRLGVEKIYAHRQPFLKRLHQELPRLGFEPLTPPESTSALISFAVKDYKSVQQRLQKASVNARVSQRYIHSATYEYRRRYSMT